MRAFGFSIVCLALAAAQAVARFPVIGYWPNWAGGIPQIQYQYLTHINYSFGGVDGNGNVNGVDDGQIRDLVTRGHAAGTKVGVALGGGGGDKGFVAFTGSATATANFIKSAVALCDKYNLDGIDIDWEYTPANQAVQFEAWMKTLADALHAKGRYVSVAVIGGDASHGKDVHDGVFESADFINIMAYDNPTPNHSTYEIAKFCMDYWTVTRKCPKAKAILGVPFYGRDASGNSYTSYSDLVARDPSATQKDLSNGIGYNGIPTMQKKTQLAFDEGSGIMIWKISQDTHDATSLLKAINDKIATFPASAINSRGAVAMSSASASPFLSLIQGRFHVAAPEAGRYVLGIRDLSGTLIRSDAISVQDRGDAVLSFGPGEISPGLYGASLQGPGSTRAGTVNSRTQKLIVPVRN